MVELGFELKSCDRVCCQPVHSTYCLGIQRGVDINIIAGLVSELLVTLPLGIFLPGFKSLIYICATSVILPGFAFVSLARAWCQRPYEVVGNCGSNLG